MARYIDTATGDLTNSVGHWLQENLVPGFETFHVQSAWFSYGALEPFAGILREAIEGGTTVRLVVGSNGGSLSRNDLDRVWELLESGDNAGLIVVRYGNAVFHPKTFLIRRADQSVTAVVGSPNLTGPGLSWNVEASVVFDTADGDDPAELANVLGAINRWFDLEEDGVFHVSSADDIDRLAEGGIIDVPQPSRIIERRTPVNEEGHEDADSPKVGFRSRTWKPPIQAAIPFAEQVVGQPAELQPGLQIIRWAKKLMSSDAQQVQPGTNPTGKLRLTKSVFDIDKNTYFRDALFGSETWEAEVRNDGRTYEVAMVELDVRFGTSDLGRRTLMVDHALHRVADQANVPTVLGWGHDLGRELATNSRLDQWVTIERLNDGTYRLQIQPDRPHWA